MVAPQKGIIRFPVRCIIWMGIQAMTENDRPSIAEHTNRRPIPVSDREKDRAQSHNGIDSLSEIAAAINKSNSVKELPGTGSMEFRRRLPACGIDVPKGQHPLCQKCSRHRSHGVGCIWAPPN